MKTTPIWITWEGQRRSRVLSKEFGAEYYELVSPHVRGIRYIVSSMKTIFLLFNKRPRLLFVQNPSLILTVLACIYRHFRSRSVLIVDRHSNFFDISTSSFVNKIHRTLSRFTLRIADLTMVSNEHLRELVDSTGGRGVVLEDKIPVLNRTSRVDLKGDHNVLFVCSFDIDEPYGEVLDSTRFLDSGVCIYVTGDYRKNLDRVSLDSRRENLMLLGFLPEQDYINYLWSVDVIMVLTEWEHTLLCGAYESVAVEKPIILSNKKDLLQYFNKGVVGTTHEPESIAQAIRCALNRKEALSDEIRLLKAELQELWAHRFAGVTSLINSLGNE